MTQLDALLQGLDARQVRGQSMTAGVEVRAVTIDSRKVGPGVVFVACPGATATSRDGHAFIADAARAGAAALIVQDEARVSDILDAVPVPVPVPVFVVADARRAAALLAERLCGSPSSAMRLVGITGTNGKTTTTWLVAQLCAAAGLRAGVFGTLGVGSVDAPRALGFTTPEAEVLSAELARMRGDGLQVVAMEVSSHALATARVDGMDFAVTAFTHLTRDHLDFHGTMERYFDAKFRLFAELAPRRPAVLPMVDDEEGFNARLRAGCAAAGVQDIVGWGAGARVHARDVRFLSRGIEGTLVVDGHEAPFSSPMLGAYNLDNILVAVGCARALGLSLADIVAGLRSAKPPPGRLERVAVDGGPAVVVDYAHTPDALERALHVIRGVTAGKLTVVFGCGGDRDPGKRAHMGRVAAEVADSVVVTDDNPRTEDGSLIAAAVEEGVRSARDGALRKIGAAQLEAGTFAVERARRMAIRAAVHASAEGDVILLAGKGHEGTQTIGARVLPFDDLTEASRALRGEASRAFLDGTFVREALGRRSLQLHGALPAVFLGVSTDSRKVEPESLFVALKGDNFDGHQFVDSALRVGRARAALVVHERGAQVLSTGPLLRVDDTLLALQDLARAHLRAIPGRRVALTGSNGKTTTKELIAGCLRAALGSIYVHATEGNLNNHIGVPLTALQCEPEHAALVFEMGMNHLGEIAALADIVAPEVALITNIGTAHAGNVGGIEGVARAKAEVWECLPASAVAVVNADDPRCVREAQQKAKCRHLSFGRAPWADVRLLATRDRETGGQDLELSYGGTTVETSIPLDGKHNAGNAAGAVAAAVALGLPFDVCARGLAMAHHAHGRLERFVLAGGVWLLDDTYNANPDSMEAALGTLADLAGSRRRVVVLGEMRELGAYAESAHRHIGAAAAQAGAVQLFACGEMGRLYGEGAVRAGLSASAFVWAKDNAALAPLVADAIHDGDVVLIKGSRGARMEVVVNALRGARGGGGKG